MACAGTTLQLTNLHPFTDQVQASCVPDKHTWVDRSEVVRPIYIIDVGGEPGEEDTGN